MTRHGRRQLVSNRKPQLLRASLVSAWMTSLFLFLMPAAPAAHDIPSDVTIHMFLKPEGQRLEVLVRVPLVSMRDMDYPRRGPVGAGQLDLARAEPALRDAA